VKIKSYSVFIAILFLAGCTKQAVPPRLCGMPLLEADGIRLKSESPPVLEATGFPASVRIGNIDSAEPRTCTFELTGPQVRPDQLFFRFGPEEAKVEVLSKDRVRITYPIRFQSYGVVSLEPVVTPPANPHRFENAGLSFGVSGGMLLRIDAGVPRVRSLGPATQVHIANAGEKLRHLELLVDNTSDRLSEAQMRGVGPGQVVLKRESPLVLRLTGELQPGENVWLTLLPRPLRHPYSFVFGGDVKEQLEVFLGLMKQVRAKADPLFMLAVGDYTRNSLPSEIDLFLRKTADLPFPVYYVKGNHESRCQGDAHYRRFFGPENFSLKVSQMLFIIMDTSATVHDQKGYRITPEAFQAAEKALALNPSTSWKFIALHVPPHPLHGAYQHKDLNSNLNAQDAERIKSLAEKNQVSYVLSGHAHLYARKAENGVVYLTSGGGGALLHDYSPLPGFSINTEKHLMLFHVTAGGIEEEMITSRPLR
jgi:UDP-2,3-diacylglucosamine pyrophosphatase LpxH